MKDKKNIYFDNAATTFPKPECVINEMISCMKNYCANPGRSGHKLAMRSNKAVYDARCEIAGFFNAPDPLHVIFTKNATESLNIVANTLAEIGGHIIITAYEHNSVIRALYRFCKIDKLRYDIIVPNETGCIDPVDIENSIEKDTIAVLVSLASNITGYILPVKQIGEICKKHNIIYAIDVSQGAGTIRPDMIDNNVNIIAGTGHKDLYGPQGTGFICTDGFQPAPLLYGGTGTDSMSSDPPVIIPEMLEAGTLNLPGIVGLAEGIKFIKKIGNQKIIRHKQALINYMSYGLENIKKITSYIPDFNCGIVAIDIADMDSQEAVQILSEKYGICTRGGFHCSPNVHRFLKTDGKGLIRFSFGIFNDRNEIDYTLNALEFLKID